jgi:ferredoxin
MVKIKHADFDNLLQAIKHGGYQLVGPTIQNKVIVYDRLESAADLPIAWTERQEGATYRLEKRSDNAYFGYVLGPQSWKKFLFPNKLKLWEAEKDGNHFHIKPTKPKSPKLAFIGARPCEIAALQIQDKIFSNGTYSDPHYSTRRKNVLIIAVNCIEPGGTCFCASMNTGPEAKNGFDLALTEVIKQKYFLVESGSKIGEEILGEVPHEEASDAEIDAAKKLLEKAAKNMGRTLDTDDLPAVLESHFEHPKWFEIAKRCLSCTNCTMVCPTCFCSTVEDTTDLGGKTATRTRRWDSCFTLDFTYIHGGSVRQTPMSRYRQWMMHKLARWQEQFGTSGCVGCGRCITWCPVGIDITEEARKFREMKKKK